jgi:hypothetical protein
MYGPNAEIGASDRPLLRSTVSGDLDIPPHELCTMGAILKGLPAVI